MNDLGYPLRSGNNDFRLDEFESPRLAYQTAHAIVSPGTGSTLGDAYEVVAHRVIEYRSEFVVEPPFLQ